MYDNIVHYENVCLQQHPIEWSKRSSDVHAHFPMKNQFATRALSKLCGNMHAIIVYYEDLTSSPDTADQGSVDSPHDSLEDSQCRFRECDNDLVHVSLDITTDGEPVISVSIVVRHVFMRRPPGSTSSNASDYLHDSYDDESDGINNHTSSDSDHNDTHNSEDDDHPSEDDYSDHDKDASSTSSRGGYSSGSS